jgi:hypothetical protein
MFLALIGLAGESSRGHFAFYEGSRRINQWGNRVQLVRPCKADERLTGGLDAIHARCYGAAAAVLAFIGGLASKDLIGLSPLSPVAESLTNFDYGVVAAVAAMGLTYAVHFLTAFHSRSQVKIWEFPYTKDGKYSKLWESLKVAVHLLTLAVAISSVWFFVMGIFAVRNAITQFVHWSL